MAELHTTSINEPTEREQMTLEKQGALMDEAKAALDNAPKSVLGDVNDNNEEAPLDERPQWLPEKFESPEELAKAYANLEKQFHTKGREEEKQQVNMEQTAVQTRVGDALNAASSEYAERGDLTEASYAALEKNGISRELVKTYVDGFKASQEANTNAIMDEVGGRDNYAAMTEWASGSLTDSELATFNRIVESNDPDSAKLAIKGLYSRFLSDGGSPVKLMQGQVAGGGVTPFNSNAQMVEAMKDSRYSKDPAYRAQVEKRISISRL
jgi:hypothetical protein